MHEARWVPIKATADENVVIICQTFYQNRGNIKSILWLKKYKSKEYLLLTDVSDFEEPSQLETEMAVPTESCKKLRSVIIQETAPNETGLG